MQTIIIGIALLWAAGAGAVTAPYETDMNQSIVHLDTLEVDTENFTSGLLDTYFSGGKIAEATLANPAYSGTRVYGGTALLLTVGPVVQDLIDYSWPDIGGFITSTAIVSLTLSYWDPVDFIEKEAFTVTAPAGSLHFYLSGTMSDAEAGYFTSALFSSDEYFSIDTVKLGLPNVGPGVPEPASWALLVTGFALTGSALRRRRAFA